MNFMYLFEEWLLLNLSVFSCLRLTVFDCLHFITSIFYNILIESMLDTVEKYPKFLAFFPWNILVTEYSIRAFYKALEIFKM